MITRGDVTEVNTNNIVSITEANQNFSKAARLVEENGTAIILKNNVSQYVILEHKELESMNMWILLQRKRCHKILKRLRNWLMILLTAAQVMSLHSTLFENTGGFPDVLNREMLSSALGAPFQTLQELIDLGLGVASGKQDDKDLLNFIHEHRKAFAG